MDENEYIALILKHLNKETSPAEQAGLRQWLDADPRNRLEYQTVEKIWIESGQVLQDRQFDKEAAWIKVTDTLSLPAKIVTLSQSTAQSQATVQPQGIDQPQTVPAPQHLPRVFAWKTMLAAASVLLILLSAAGWWYYTQRSGGDTHIVRATGTRNLNTPDGSTVTLYDGATLTYSEKFTDRTVQLQGRALFSLANNPNNPFRIYTAHSIIEQMGTSLQVNNSPAEDEVTVAKGKVRFTDREDAGNRVVVLAGVTMKLADGRFIASGGRDSSIISRKTGILDFRGEPLQQAAEDIGLFYQLSVTISPDLRPDAGKIIINARFEHQPVEEVIEEIKLMTNLTIKREKDTLVFSRK
jgi:ferric-dicitrate binding protein FerR (iron transport regulator)